MSNEAERLEQTPTTQLESTDNPFDKFRIPLDQFNLLLENTGISSTSKALLLDAHRLNCFEKDPSGEQVLSPQRARLLFAYLTTPATYSDLIELGGYEKSIDTLKSKQGNLVRSVLVKSMIRLAKVVNNLDPKLNYSIQDVVKIKTKSKSSASPSLDAPLQKTVYRKLYPMEHFLVEYWIKTEDPELKAISNKVISLRAAHTDGWVDIGSDLTRELRGDFFEVCENLQEIHDELCYRANSIFKREYRAAIDRIKIKLN